MRRRACIIAAGVVAAAALVVGCGAKESDYSPRRYYNAVLDACNIPDTSGYVQIMDGGKSIALRGMGEKGLGLTAAQLGCALGAMKMPESHGRTMMQTRAIDGRQSASWDGFFATWTYHPDTGLSVTVTDSYAK